MWRSLLALVILVGFFSLAHATPADAQQFPSPPIPPGLCNTIPCQGIGAFDSCSSAVSYGCPISYPGCAPYPILGSLAPTGVVLSRQMGARYATYADGTPPLPPRIGPNPQSLIADAFPPLHPCNALFLPVVGSTPGSFGYNVGPRRGFNPYSSQDAYLQTLNAVVAPGGTGYLLSWTSGTTFSGTSHEVYQCPESDTPLIACRSAGVINAETRQFGPVPGGFTYVVRTQGYGGYTGTIGWGGQIEGASSRLPLPILPPPTAGGPDQ
jgi:hypothetical protein